MAEARLVLSAPSSARPSIWPGAVAGLYFARLAAEAWATRGGITLSVINALAIAFIGAALGAVAGRAWQRRSRWPSGWTTLPLLLYVVAPEPRPSWAVGALLLAAGTAALAEPPPRNGRREAGLAVFVVTTAALLLYLATLAPDLLPADSGEFQHVGAVWGVAHPPGFTLYTIAANVVARLPLGPTAAWRINLFSAVTSALTVGLVYAIIFRLERSHAAALTAALALATATTFWAQATTANIRSLTALFLTAALYALVVWRERRQRGAPNADRALALAALALSGGVLHHASLVFATAVALAFVLALDRPLIRQPRRWARPLLLALLPLVTLLYLPLRGAAMAPGSLGAALDTWPGFLDHVLARGFQGDLFYFVAPADLLPRFLIMGNVFILQFTPWLLAGMGLGVLFNWRRHADLVALWGGIIVVHTLITATYRAPQTVEYMLPAYIPAVLLLGLAIGRLRAYVTTAPRPPQAQALVAGLLAAALVAAGAQGVARYRSFASVALSSPTRHYAQNTLEGAPGGALVLANWHWVTPTRYLQDVERRRRELTVQYVFPTAEPYAVTWARHTEGALAEGRSVVTTQYDTDAFAALPPPEPLGDAFLFRAQPRLERPADFQPLALSLADALVITGVHLSSDRITLDESVVVSVAWETLSALPEGARLFAHLTTPDGQIVAQDDVPARPAADGVSVTRLRLTPRPGARLGGHEVLLGAAAAEPLTAADGAERTAVGAVTLNPATWAPYTANPVYRPEAGPAPGRRLVGFDWDHTLPVRRLFLHWQLPGGYVSEIRDVAGDRMSALPAWRGPWGLARNHAFPDDGESRYVPFGQGIVWTGPPLDMARALRPGQTVTLWQSLHSNRPVNNDLAISVRLIGFAEDGFHWEWWDLADGIPAMGALPTLKWIAGTVVYDPHRLQVAANAQEGQSVGAVLRIYDVFTGRPVPILDERILALPLPLVPTGTTTVANPGRQQP